MDREKRLWDLVDWAWTIIANANHGNWETVDPEWREAAERWRDKFHEELDSWSDHVS